MGLSIYWSSERSGTEWNASQARPRYETHAAVVMCCTIHISPNDLPEFPSAASASFNDATASPHSAFLQIENSFSAILLKMNGTVH